MKKFLSLFLLAFILACTPTKVRQSRAVSANTKNTTKIILSREKNKTFELLPAVFGYDGEDYLTLSSGEVKEILAPVGKHEFYIKPNKLGKSHRVVLSVRQNQVTCLKVKVNKKYNKAKTALAPEFYFVEPFNIMRYDCNNM